jgi:hypothetical protein
MLKAYHMIGLDSADFFRLKDGRITEEEIVLKGCDLFEDIVKQEVISSSATRKEEGQSRQFHLDRLVGDNQYVYLSLGKRYWNDPTSCNFGFIFDVEQLLLQQNAILRTHDLLDEYGELLDTVVREFVPDRREDEFSPEEVEKLIAALEDPESDYTSPNDAYYTLMDAVEHQKSGIPQVRDATFEFIKRAQRLQKSSQLAGEEAVRLAHQEGETGRFEILVKESLSLSHCIGTIQHGREYMGYPYHVRRFGKKYGVVLYSGIRPVGETLYDTPTHAQRCKRRLNKAVKEVDEIIKRDSAIII